MCQSISDSVESCFNSCNIILDSVLPSSNLQQGRNAEHVPYRTVRVVECGFRLKEADIHHRCGLLLLPVMKNEKGWKRWFLQRDRIGDSYQQGGSLQSASVKDQKRTAGIAKSSTCCARNTRYRYWIAWNFCPILEFKLIQSKVALWILPIFWGK